MKRRDLSDLKARSLDVMKAHWRQGKSAESHKRWGYTCPNPERYEWQWLWDSCFHAVIWAELGEADRGLLELETLLATMQPTGFLPHMNYVADPAAAQEFWGRAGTSSITQPPMFGHAIGRAGSQGSGCARRVGRQGCRSPAIFLGASHRRAVRLGESSATRGSQAPTTASAGTASTQFPTATPAGRAKKPSCWESIQRDSYSTPLSNPLFPAASAWFAAVVAFNIAELASTTDAIAATEADGLVEAVENSWDYGLRTWVDAATHENPDASTERCSNKTQ